VVVPEFDPITGRYVYVELGGVPNRVYFEEAGEGRPLVCLHTAGADSRQFRHLLCDAEVTGGWRVVAFDLPYHGRSLPPEGWWEKEYLLTTGAYAETVMTFVRALDLERPVVLGCSMGGAVVLELARSYASEIGAVIGLEAASKIEGRFTDWQVVPDIDGSEMAASWTYGLMAPQSPEANRREVWWTYAQGGPGIYRGDTYFYSVDWDLRGREVEIDTARCPVYLLTGEYDYACTPEETSATADAIPGARSVKMEGIGHFPMAENYPVFREYLLPILEELEENERL
jgi:pimeloyl-ACP methyl ester carboxylesterase